MADHSVGINGCNGSAGVALEDTLNGSKAGQLLDRQPTIDHVMISWGGVCLEGSSMHLTVPTCSHVLFKCYFSAENPGPMSIASKTVPS